MKTKILLIIVGVLCSFNMSPNTYRASNNCVNTIKQFEQCSLTAYWDSNGYSIGYGHHTNVKKHDRITHNQAVKYLHQDIKTAEYYVNHLIDKLPYDYKFSQHFIDGFISFVYNVGVGNAERSVFYQRLRRCRVNKGRMNKCDKEFALVGIKSSCITAKGHINRRKHEYNLMRK